MNGLGRILRATLILFLLGGEPANAQTAVMRGGEHDGFTRLVFAATPSIDWTVSRVEGGLAISFRPGLPDLDLANVHDRITQDRLRAVRVEGDTLLLDLSCECGARIFAAGEGNVAIDIGAAFSRPETETTRPPARTASAGRILPLIDRPQTRAPIPYLAGFDTASAERSRDDGPSEEASASAGAPEIEAADVDSAGDGETAEVAGLQIAIHRHPGLRRPEGTPPPSAERRALAPSCELEPKAAGILQVDPDVVLEELWGAIAGIYDDGDGLSTSGARHLAIAYLQAGWGAEARQVLAAIPQADDPALDRIGALLDDDPEAEAPDPACGPASALLALRLGVTADRLDRTDLGDLARFLADLPHARIEHLAPALRRAAGYADARELESIIPDQDHHATTDPGSAAHLDEPAVHAVLQALDHGTADRLMFENALALRPSIPAGELRDQLDRVLARRLVEAGMTATALPLVATGAADADVLLAEAISSLPEAQAAEAAMRLLPHVTRGGRPAIDAARLFEMRGLEETARLFLDDGRVREGGGAMPRVSDRADNPWIARDLVHVASDGSADDADATHRLRGALAESILSRNGIPGAIADPANPIEAPEGDLARAERDLRDSRALREVVEALLSQPGAS